MHELAIANSIVKTVVRESEKNGYKSVIAVGLRIGALTDIVPEALEFGFNAIVAGTPLDGARLEIEHIPVKGVCEECHRPFEVHNFVFVCPECGASNIKLEQGQELDITYIEIDDH